MTRPPDVLIETPDSPGTVPGPSGADVVSDVLRVFRASGSVLLRGDFRDPWGWSAPPSGAIAAMLHPGATRLVIFHVVAEGSCWVEVAGGSRERLERGAIVCFPHGHAHRMGSGEVPACVPIASLFPPRPWRELPVLRQGGDGPATRIVCVYLRCDDLLFNPLLDALPEVLIARPAADHAWRWLEANLHFLTEEARRGSVGTSCVLARITELLFVEMLRRHVAALPAHATGWLAALRDPVTARALHLIHAAPDRRWPVAELAREAGASRTVLAERFQALLGTTPGRYLTRWRLQIAAQRMLHEDLPLAEVALRAGFGSEEAFGRAFKRFADESPAAWARRRRRLAAGLVYERLGSWPGIEALVARVFARHLDNPDLRSAFADMDAEAVARLKRVTAELFASACGGPERYTGRDLREVHTGLGVTSGQFRAALADIAAAADDLGVHPDDRREILALCCAVEDQIVL